jgi:hypothetical protein
LDELARAPMTDEAWLQAVREFAALHVRPSLLQPSTPALVALLLLRKA